MILKTNMYEHQLKAVDKLIRIKIGALYMEMGTGKTRVALEMAVRRYQQGKINRVIWLCPCSVKESLKRELLKHIDSIDFITICGIETLSTSVRENARLLSLVETEECFLIVDESNLVKNFEAKRTQSIVLLSKNCPYRLILNGTPVSRDESDLFSQWYILDWRILGYKSYWSFSANHLQFDERRPGRHIRVLNKDYLTKKIAPYSYQVLKKECLNLPEKTYKKNYFRLSEEQSEHYYEVFDRLLGQLNELEPHTIYQLLNYTQGVVSGYHYSFELPPGVLDEYKVSDLIIKKERFFQNAEEEPRMKALGELIHRIDEDEKVIIFCKYTDEINAVVNFLNENYGYAVKFNGEVSLKERQKNIDLFENEARFLVANKQCAGYGLNLQFCSYIIYYSNDWDWATREQSEDRIHRIGQENNVHIIDLIASNTVDERIISNLEHKTDLVAELKEKISRLKDKTELKVELEEYLHDSKKERQEMRYGVIRNERNRRARRKRSI